MKLSILFVVLFITYINVSGYVLQICATIASKALNCQLTKTLNLDVSHIQVYFYDLKNGGHWSYPISKAVQGILSHNIKKTNQFFVYVGGFKSNMNKKSTKRVEKAFTKIKNSYLIIFDHSAYTNNNENNTIKSYERSVKHVPYIGMKLAQILAGLQKSGVSAKNIHCIGHSLGSQILGHVGDHFRKVTGKKIARITALDPAGPCFADKSNEEHIRSGVADYVEVYHCNAGVLGSSKSLADVDFFVNNGQSQPNCKSSPFRSSVEECTCSHKTCMQMWTASLMYSNRYLAYECNKYSDFKRGKCSKNQITTAGFFNPGTAKGKYYFSTNGYDLD